jgi:hypothetical protein
MGKAFLSLNCSGDGVYLIAMDFVVLFCLCKELFFNLCPKKGGKKVRANGLLIDE